jgi:hypothetical protein
VVVVAAIAAVAARVAAPARRHVPARLAVRYAYGVERWDIKTLKDRPQLLRARPTTVAYLIRLPRLKPFPPQADDELTRRRARMF